MEQTKEINADAEVAASGKLRASNYDQLMQISNSHRPFYHVDKIVICPSSDNHAIQGVQFSIDKYERADSGYYEFANVNLDNLFDLELSIIGQERGACFSFKLAEDDHVIGATVWYSEQDELIRGLAF